MLQELSRSRYFTKLDLRKGYHQIGLDKESRQITTFVTHQGLFRDKRFMFGISSAPEMYQNIVRQVLHGCGGSVNIPDDVIVHGKTKQEHDERLQCVLQRFEEKGLTLNPEKCEFARDQVHFMVHIISPAGISPAPDKTSAIANARAPQNASEVRSFLGLVHFPPSFYLTWPLWLNHFDSFSTLTLVSCGPKHK